MRYLLSKKLVVSLEPLYFYVKPSKNGGAKEITPYIMYIQVNYSLMQFWCTITENIYKFQKMYIKKGNKI